MAAVPAATHARKFCLHQGFGSAQYRTDETHGWAAISSCRGGLRFCELHLFALYPRYNENPGAVLIRRPSGFGPVLGANATAPDAVCRGRLAFSGPGVSGRKPSAARSSVPNDLRFHAMTNREGRS